MGGGNADVATHKTRPPVHMDDGRMHKLAAVETVRGTRWGGGGTEECLSRQEAEQERVGHWYPNPIPSLSPLLYFPQFCTSKSGTDPRRPIEVAEAYQEWSPE